MSTAEIDFMEFLEREAPTMPGGSGAETVRAYSKEVVAAYQRAVAERRAQLEASIASLRVRRDRVAGLRHGVEVFEQRFVALTPGGLRPGRPPIGASPSASAPAGWRVGDLTPSLPPRPLPSETIPAPVVEDLIRRSEHELAGLERQHALAAEEAAAAEQGLKATALFASPDARHELRDLVEAAAALSRAIDEWRRLPPIGPNGSTSCEPPGHATDSQAQSAEARRVDREATTSRLALAPGIAPIATRPVAGVGAGASPPGAGAPPPPPMVDPPSPPVMPTGPVPAETAPLPPPPAATVPAPTPEVPEDPSASGASPPRAPRTVVDTRRPYASPGPGVPITVLHDSGPGGGFLSRLPGHLLMLSGAVIVIATLLVLKFG